MTAENGKFVDNGRQLGMVEMDKKVSEILTDKGFDNFKIEECDKHTLHLIKLGDIEISYNSCVGFRKGMFNLDIYAYNIKTVESLFLLASLAQELKAMSPNGKESDISANSNYFTGGDRRSINCRISFDIIGL